MRVEIDRELEDIFPSYLETRKQEVSVYKKYLEQEDFESLRHLGHKIAGNAGAYGLKQLGVLCRQLEQQATDKESAACEATIEAIGIYLMQVEPIYVDFAD